MSKIGSIRLDLDEQAERLGFGSLEQAQSAGCEVEWYGESAKLVEPLELAHRAWEKEKEEVLKGLKEIMLTDTREDRVAINRAIKFIEEAHE